MEKKLLNVVLMGNPNCGKSSLFNALTGLNQQVGNYPGVTVEKRTGKFKLDNGSLTNVRVTDLPGSYSLYPKSIDQGITLNEICQNDDDITLVILDASNLKRSLLLCTQTIDLNKSTIVALNMLDVANKKGIKIDSQQLQKELGVTIIPINARKKEGIEELKKEICLAQKPK
ncbi:MAG: 50S ribosome-binding GTPase, partial [Bacteroidia bacterium]|nr:50S ribosome-binding GTPase [Bacteroidia bacterium]